MPAVARFNDSRFNKNRPLVARRFVVAVRTTKLSTALLKSHSA